MKNAKALISIFLAAAIIFVSGCSNAPSVNENDTKDNTKLTSTDIATKYAGLTEIKNLFAEKAYPLSVDISGDNILIFSTKLTDNDLNIYYLVLYNLKEEKIILKKSLTDSKQMEINDACFYDKDKIAVIDVNREKGIIYDFNFNKIDEVEYKYYSGEELEEKAKKSPFVNGSFGYYDDYTADYENKMKICVFYDNPQYAFVDRTDSDQILDSFGKIMLCVKYESNGKSLDFSVNDYEKAICINKVKTEVTEQDVYVNPAVAALNDKYVCVICEYSNSKGEEPLYIPYIWEYSAEPVNSCIDVRAMTEEDFGRENNSLIDDIKNKYTINVYVDKKIDYSDYEISYGVKPLDLYLLLNQLNDGLAVFPDNFITEMYSDLDGDYDFNINIVKDIGDSIDAFAFAFEHFDITFATEGFTKNIVYHEMMHLIYERINNYYNDRGENFYALWEELNDGIEYNPDAEEVNNDYFVSNYAMTNADEDMAETFQFLCETNENDEMPDWLKSETANKKAVFLCKTIRKVFPSVSSIERAYWEKYIDYNHS